MGDAFCMFAPPPIAHLCLEGDRYLWPRRDHLAMPFASELLL